MAGLVDLRQLVTNRNPSLALTGLRLALRVLCLPYLVVVQCRNWAYDLRLKTPYRSRLPVISVGNLSVGGTGKSPTVAWLARWLRHRRIRVAILSRGYGALDNGQNDEALELELQLPDVPHLQHWDRIASAKLAEEELDMQLLLLDDGFQHRRMQRDLDIVLLDASDPPAANWPLPAGLLREPMRSLKRADAVLFTRADQADPAELARLERMVKRRAPQAVLLRACHRPSHLWSLAAGSNDLAQLKGKRVLAFCGIGNPQSFFSSLAQLSATVVDSMVWPDHHGYETDDVNKMCRWVEAHPQAELVVCTMKDWVKLQTEQLGSLPLGAVAIELFFLSGQNELEIRLEEMLAKAQC